MTNEMANSRPDASPGFVAGTLVHTKGGLIPIEKIQIGHWVLSQPESKGERGYRRVTRTIVFEDIEIDYFAYVANPHTNEARDAGLFVTYDHPFWVKDVGWKSMREMQFEAELELNDGSHALYYSDTETILYKTETENVGWIETSPDGCEGHLVDFSDTAKIGNINIYSSDMSINEFALENRQCIKQRVYNIEVEEFHTYYVGEVGVWVHNM